MTLALLALLPHAPAAAAGRPLAEVLPVLQAVATSVPAPVPLRILNDPGGEIAVRVRHVAHLAQRGVPVRIEGACHSACTLYLALETVCVTPGARLGFHGPRAVPSRMRAAQAAARPDTRATSLGLPAAQAARWTAVMAAHYPEPLRAWFLARMAEDPEPLRVLSGRQLIAAGMTACN